MRLNHASLKALHERSGISLAALARESGIDRANLTRLVNGQRKGTNEQIVKLAAVLKVPVMALMGPERGDTESAA